MCVIPSISDLNLPFLAHEEFLIIEECVVKETFSNVIDNKALIQLGQYGKRGVTLKMSVVLGRLASNRKFDVYDCGGGHPPRFAPKFAGIRGVWAQLIALLAWLTVAASTSIRARFARL
ncbi:hypothetical protein L596_030804 [Steinernema carpocapsae]|uniref:Uncharacterized protein n=1 Tax=Steinernema carpocapsae TaxID=34508 RepID=A0A4V5ZWV8_STECR|nr:hypothetical protein L596_030804 [Steinernema carpocapsae]